MLFPGLRNVLSTRRFRHPHGGWLCLALLAGVGLPLRADPLFTFTLSGDGYTVQFSQPEPKPIPFYTSVENFLYFNSVGTASVNGVDGYSVGGFYAVAGPASPPFGLDVSPVPPGLTLSNYGISTFGMYVGGIAQLVSMDPTLPGTSYPPTLGIATYQWIPGQYSAEGVDRDGHFGPYTLDITEDQPAAATPEAPAWLLAITGAVCIALLRVRKDSRFDLQEES